MTHVRYRAPLALATACAAVLATPTPAHAEQVAVADGADTAQSNNDVRGVVFVHDDDGVTVRVTVDALRKRDNAGVILYFDKRASRRGPEFTQGIPLYRTSTEYVVYRAEDWRAVGDPIDCEVSTRQRWKKDVVIFRGSGDCFDGADRLRLAVRMSDSSGGPTVVDWVTGRRVFTDWLAAGDPDA